MALSSKLPFCDELFRPLIKYHFLYVVNNTKYHERNYQISVAISCLSDSYIPPFRRFITYQ